MSAPPLLSYFAQISALVLLAALCLRPSPLSAAEPARAPRTCTDEVHRALKREVGRACKTTSMKCYENHSCAELIANWLTYQRCITARVAVMEKCFNGGDKFHQDEASHYKVGAAECSRILIENRCPQRCE